MHELGGATEPQAQELLAKFSPVDLVIVEGMKSELHPKMEVYRKANGKPLMFPRDSAIVGVAADATVETVPRISTSSLP
jgi:molybdopterin-guanine dinucleotide biosynthesis protein B